MSKSRSSSITFVKLCPNYRDKSSSFRSFLSSIFYLYFYAFNNFSFWVLTYDKEPDLTINFWVISFPIFLPSSMIYCYKRVICWDNYLSASSERLTLESFFKV